MIPLAFFILFVQLPWRDALFLARRRPERVQAARRPGDHLAGQAGFPGRLDGFDDGLPCGRGQGLEAPGFAYQHVQQGRADQVAVLGPHRQAGHLHHRQAGIVALGLRPALLFRREGIAQRAVMDQQQVLAAELDLRADLTRDGKDVPGMRRHRGCCLGERRSWLAQLGSPQYFIDDYDYD